MRLHRGNQPFASPLVTLYHFLVPAMAGLEEVVEDLRGEPSHCVRQLISVRLHRRADEQNRSGSDHDGDLVSHSSTKQKRYVLSYSHPSEH